MISRRGLVAAAGGLAAGMMRPDRAAAVGTFPNKPITLIMPWPAGTGVDIWHRALAAAMAKRLGQPVVVDNRAGAAGTLGPAAMAATAKPDGYTICHMPITMLRLPLMQKVSFDPLADFTWIVHLSGFVFTLAVRADSPHASLADLVAFARANPGKLTYASPGAGTSLHIGMELIARRAGVTFTHVPFKGMTDSLAALEGGHVAALAGGTEVLPMAGAGRLRLLCVWSEKRSPRAPDVPTLTELGYPFVFDSPFGLAGPKGMDHTVVAVLHDAARDALADADVVALRQRFDLQDRYMGTSAYAAFIAELHAKEKKYLTDIGLAKKS